MQNVSVPVVASPEIVVQDKGEMPPTMPPQTPALYPPSPDSMFSMGTTGLIAQDGQPCTSPISYRGTPVTGCVTFAAVPGTPLCWLSNNSTNGTWSLCKPGAEVSVRGITTQEAQQRITASRQPCILPVVHRVRRASSPLPNSSYSQHHIRKMRCS